MFECFPILFFYLVAFPLGQVPVLEVDDVIITQTRAITRYLGREFGRHACHCNFIILTLIFLISSISFIIMALGLYPGLLYNPKRFLIWSYFILFKSFLNFNLFFLTTCECLKDTMEKPILKQPKLTVLWTFVMIWW